MEIRHECLEMAQPSFDNQMNGPLGRLWMVQSLRSTDRRDLGNTGIGDMAPNLQGHRRRDPKYPTRVVGVRHRKRWRALL
ncbi:hypothetical protein MAXJ12_24887 [Mesorhizobium alhagi CCNWXJ12-2]|jgi:hypothetical protein|uniref:Uncharacterized protein n=1 Tax=Mesorhizobium alhagi CCNWXJ12-2 TaxID=1107882 RepID=H0HXS8_9HYPH|nr:hypothetical protein MAXJ12_24887 [Mesorhizobium alhagi CCNWXJ12-2]